MKIKIQKDGPYLVSGEVPLKKEIIGIGEDNEQHFYKEGEKYIMKKEYALCRCGQSKNKPYCDGSHVGCGFDGTETASKEKFTNMAETYQGHDFGLLDAKELCASARFCHPYGGVWKLTRESMDPEMKRRAIEEACLCPSGRLVAMDKNGQEIEPRLEKELSLLEDPQKAVSGPIWVKGGIEIENSEGDVLEARNRVTLCRCGQSKNKPYCDGSHIKCKFNDGDESLDL